MCKREFFTKQSCRKPRLIIALLAGVISLVSAVFDASAEGLDAYTPPAMFSGDNQQKSYSKAIPLEEVPVEIFAKHQKSLPTFPPVEKLLGYKDLAFKNSRVSKLPVPRHKPEYSASRHEMLSDYTAKPNNRARKKSTKIVNDTSFRLMTENERKTMVELLLNKPVEEKNLSKANNRREQRQAESEYKIAAHSDNTRNKPPSDVKKIKERALRPPMDIIHDVNGYKGNINQSSRPAITKVKEKKNKEQTTQAISRDIQEKLAAKQPASAQSSKSGEKNKVSAYDHKRLKNQLETPLTLAFEEGQTELSSAHKQVLSDILEDAHDKIKLSRIEIRAFSVNIDDTQSGARRISLARALAVREYLLQMGVAPENLDLRALGNQAKGTLKDKVDINLSSI